MKWIDAPTHEGPWWFTTHDCRTPALARVTDMRMDGDVLRFATEHTGTEDRSHEDDYIGAQWAACVAPPNTRDP